MVTVPVRCLVPPPLEYMSELHSSKQEISGRTQVWCGSRLLATYLLNGDGDGDAPPPIATMGDRVLELGAGTGLVGTVVAVARRSDDTGRVVALTDGDEEAVRSLRETLARALGDDDDDHARATTLSWGDDDDASAAAFSAWCRARWPHLWPPSDDNDDDSGITFDAIVAGDVLYRPELPRLFFETVRRYSSPATVAYLCHVPRYHVEHDIVTEAARAAGLRAEEVDVSRLAPLLRDDCPPDEAARAKVYRVTKVFTAP